MSALALPIPVSGGSTTDSPEDPASDRRRVINNEGGPDRRKVVHRGTSPSADGSEDGPPPDGLDRRKIIHRSPSAGGGLLAMLSVDVSVIVPPSRKKAKVGQPQLMSFFGKGGKVFLLF